MTTPTQAQIKAILDECQDDFHVCDKCGYQDNNATKESNLYLLLRNLTAAAEVADNHIKGTIIGGNAVQVGPTQAQIEAAIVKLWHDRAKCIRAQCSGGDGSEPGWVVAKTLDRCADELERLALV